MTFPQKLRAIQKKNASILCVGLDPDITRIPEFLMDFPDPVVEFNRRIIEATKDLVCAYKLNLAFYDVMGERGWHTIHQTLNRIPGDIITIGDAKRGDIGNSSEAYARLLLEDYEFSATTVSPYMGEDSVMPFLKDRARGAFILALTSNPGAKDFQYLPVRGKPLYENVIAAASSWNTKKNCGLVVGATRPGELKRIRSLAPDMPLLIPGVGAQGGDVEAAVRYGCASDGYLAVVNSSRGIIYASSGEDFDRAARDAALALRDDMNRYRKKYFKQ